MPCTVETRTQARAAAETLGRDSRVLATSVIAPDAEPTDRWAIELTLETRGIPPTLLSSIASQGLTVWTTAPRGEWWHVVATADSQ